MCSTHVTEDDLEVCRIRVSVSFVVARIWATYGSVSAIGAVRLSSEDVFVVLLDGGDPDGGPVPLQLQMSYWSRQRVKYNAHRMCLLPTQW